MWASGQGTPNFGSSATNLGLKDWNYDRVAVAAAAATPAAATIYLARIDVQSSFTATNLCVDVVQAGTSYTNAQLGLYSSAGTLLRATAVQASAGTNGFGSLGFQAIALAGGTQLMTAGNFYWVALHMGTNNATTATFRGTATVGTGMNMGLTASTGRAVTQTGSAANDLATIGNLTPASGSTTYAIAYIWVAIT